MAVVIVVVEMVVVIMFITYADESLLLACRRAARRGNGYTILFQKTRLHRYASPQLCKLRTLTVIGEDNQSIIDSYQVTQADQIHFLSFLGRRRDRREK